MNNNLTTKDILLAEDDRDDVFVFEMALNDAEISYELRHAENGEVLFILLKERIPHILFLDIHMPAKDGLACIKEIRKNMEFDNLPVVMYTSSLSNQYIGDCFRNGANLYVTKVDRVNDLTRKLKEIFHSKWEDYKRFPSLDKFVL